MPQDNFTNTDNTRIVGSLTVVTDPQGGTGAAGNVNIQGTTVVSGTASFASGLTASSISAGGLNSSFTAGLIASGGLNFDAKLGGVPAATTTSQSIGSSGAVTLTMTSGLSGAGAANVLFASAASATGTLILSPTGSASTSGNFQNGTEVTVVNICPNGTNLLLPSASMGSFGQFSLTISGGKGIRFIYIAPLQTWVPLATS